MKKLFFVSTLTLGMFFLFNGLSEVKAQMPFVLEARAGWSSVYVLFGGSMPAADYEVELHEPMPGGGYQHFETRFANSAGYTTAPRGWEVVVYDTSGYRQELIVNTEMLVSSI